MIRIRSRLWRGIAVAAVLAAPASAQVVSGGTSGSYNGRDVYVGSGGYGSTDGSSINVGGNAEAEARDGGVVNTGVRARTNPHHGTSRSFSRARDEDERAWSRTRVVVRNGEAVRSRTHTFYKERGERPVHDIVTDEQTRRPRRGR